MDEKLEDITRIGYEKQRELARAKLIQLTVFMESIEETSAAGLSTKKTISELRETLKLLDQWIAESKTSNRVVQMRPNQY